MSLHEKIETLLESAVAPAPRADAFYKPSKTQTGIGKDTIEWHLELSGGLLIITPVNYNRGGSRFQVPDKAEGYKAFFAKLHDSIDKLEKDLTDAAKKESAAYDKWLSQWIKK